MAINVIHDVPPGAYGQLAYAGGTRRSVQRGEQLNLQAAALQQRGAIAAAQLQQRERQLFANNRLAELGLMERARARADSTAAARENMLLQGVLTGRLDPRTGEIRDPVADRMQEQAELLHRQRMEAHEAGVNAKLHIAGAEEVRTALNGINETSDTRVKALADEVRNDLSAIHKAAGEKGWSDQTLNQAIQPILQKAQRLQALHSTFPTKSEPTLWDALAANRVLAVDAHGMPFDFSGMSPEQIREAAQRGGGIRSIYDGNRSHQLSETEDKKVYRSLAEMPIDKRADVEYKMAQAQKLTTDAVAAEADARFGKDGPDDPSKYQSWLREKQRFIDQRMGRDDTPGSGPLGLDARLFDGAGQQSVESIAAPSGGFGGQQAASVQQGGAELEQMPTPEPMTDEELTATVGDDPVLAQEVLAAEPEQQPLAVNPAEADAALAALDRGQPHNDLEAASHQRVEDQFVSLLTDLEDGYERAGTMTEPRRRDFSIVESALQAGWRPGPSFLHDDAYARDNPVNAQAREALERLMDGAPQRSDEFIKGVHAEFQQLQEALAMQAAAAPSAAPPAGTKDDPIAYGSVVANEMQHGKWYEVPYRGTSDRARVHLGKWDATQGRFVSVELADDEKRAQALLDRMRSRSTQ